MKPHQPRQYIERVNRIYHDKANNIPPDHWKSFDQKPCPPEFDQYFKENWQDLLA